MDLTRIAIEKKRITSISLLVVLFTGIGTFNDMPRAEDPGFIIRTALIVTQFPGASPERVENLVTDPLEESFREMPEVDFITSESKSGVSVVYVNIKESYKEMRPIWDKVRRKVTDVQPDLPSNVIGPFVNDEFGDVFGTLISLTGEGYDYAELKEIADDVRNELLLIPEVAKVEISGVQEERIFVEFNNAKLAELGISASQVQQILDNRNIIFPGGEIFTKDEQIGLEPSGNFESLEELRKTVIQIPGQSEVFFLDTIANVYRSYIDPPQSKTTFMGDPCLILSISLREGGNIIRLGEQVTTTMHRIQQLYPIGIDFDIIYFQPQYVDKKVNDFLENLIQSVLIVMVVMLIFLGFRTGLVVASLIPMAMVAAIMCMGFFSIGLDQMSLAALIIALGMLVDNAIVMSESIMVQMAEGKSAVSAAIDSASELKISLLTSSLTTSAAFLPIYLAESSTGEYTAPLFKVVTITLLCSWVLALTMTPLLCVLFLKVEKQESGTFGTPFYKVYRALLVTGLKYPILSLILVIGVFFGSLQLFAFVDQIFFPANEKPVMEAEFKFPLGTPIAKTEAMTKQFEAFLESEMVAEDAPDGTMVKPGFHQWAGFIGSGAPRYQLSSNPEPESPEYAYFLLLANDRDAIDTDLVPRLEAFTNAQFPDVTAKFGPLSLAEPVDAPVEIRISGKEEAEVFDIVDRIKAELVNIPGTKNIRDNWGMRTKKLFVRVNQPRAQRAGLTSQDIAVSLQTILSGIETTDFREGDDLIPIVLRSEAADRQDIGKLESHDIFVQSTGQAVPLLQVADIEIQFQAAKVRRRDGLKTVTIQVDVLPGFNAIAIANQIEPVLQEESKSWPIGYKYEQGGEIESSGEANASIGAKLPIAGLIILLLLVAQFDSVRRPAIILLTIPLGLIGVIIGLLITGQPFGFMAMLGVISLAGIVINNAIVLIDRIKLEIEENGLQPVDAVIMASQRRLRPILLTTTTTIGGLIPLWLGGGPLFEAMAVAILFGLIFATALTLGVVPLLYSMFFRVSFRGYQYSPPK